MSFDQRSLRKCHVHASVDRLLHMGFVRMQGMRRGGTLQHLKGHVSAPRSWTRQSDAQTPCMWRSPSVDA
ncbi:hypothetical protein Hanom_Chr01g00074221 [Helianthus anomalus]